MDQLQKGGNNSMTQLPPRPTSVTAVCYSSDLQVVSLIGKWAFQTSVDATTSLLVNSDAEMSVKVKDSGIAGVLSASLPHILLLIVLVVLVSHLLHFCLRFLRQPFVVCQLTAAIIIFSFLPKATDEQARRHDYDRELTLHPEIRRIEHVVGSIGIVFNMFIISLKCDPEILNACKKKKLLIIGVTCQLVTLAVGFLVCMVLYEHYHIFGEKKDWYIFYLLFNLSMSFPIGLNDCLAEMGLVNTELGRIAISAAMVQVVVGWPVLVSYMVVKQSQMKIINGVWALLSFNAVMAFIMLVFRPYALWVIRITPPNARVRDIHIFMITLAVLVFAFLSDMIGGIFTDSAVVMGLVLPDGPPLAKALIERVGTVTTEVLFPLVFMHEGFVIDWAGFKEQLSRMLWLEFLVLVTVLAKIAASVGAALYCKMSFKDGLMLGLFMNLRGILDMLLFLNLATNLHEIIDGATFTAIVLSIIATTAICAPLISFFYKPLELSKQIGLRTLQSVKSHAEIRVMTCFYDDKPVSALLEFLEASSSVEAVNSLCIYTLHLVDLQGRTAPSLICHRRKDGYVDKAQMDSVHNYFMAFEETKKEGITILPCTSNAPSNSMQNDVYSLVVEKNIAFVIVPFPKKNSMADAEAHETMHNIVPLILEQAPCSVGIMVYHGRPRIMAPPNWEYYVGVLFWGGPDDREAITIASRMACHPGIHLTVLRFRLSDRIENDESENARDDEIIGELKAENVGNGRVGVTEIELDNIQHVFSMLNTLGDLKFDLVIAGKSQECLSVQGDQLREWAEYPELGVIGDMLATDDSSTNNVLVVQQHKLPQSAIKI